MPEGPIKCVAATPSPPAVASTCNLLLKLRPPEVYFSPRDPKVGELQRNPLLCQGRQDNFLLSVSLYLNDPACFHLYTSSSSAAASSSSPLSSQRWWMVYPADPAPGSRHCSAVSCQWGDSALLLLLLLLRLPWGRMAETTLLSGTKDVLRLMRVLAALASRRVVLLIWAFVDQILNVTPTPHPTPTHMHCVTLVEVVHLYIEYSNNVPPIQSLFSNAQHFGTTSTILELVNMVVK